MKTILSLLVACVIATSAFAQSGVAGKCRSSVEVEPAIGRFVVALSDATIGEDVSAVAASLAATYGLRLEPFAADGFRGFAVTGLPSKARLLSEDLRVAWVQARAAATSATVPAPLAHVSAEVMPRVATDAVAAPAKAFRYEYDHSGNITTISTGGVTNGTFAERFRDVYLYDGVGRLRSATAKNATSPSNRQLFAYDRYGNIESIVTTSGTTAEEQSEKRQFAVNPTTNQLTLLSSCSNDPTALCATAGYDSSGNVITLGGATLSWDALGMMTELHVPGVRREQYLYDADNERIAVVTVTPDANATPTLYRYTLRGLDGKVVRELEHRLTGTTPGWSWTKDYVYRGSQLLAAIENDKGAEARRHFHLDHLDTPRLITDDAAFEVATHTYFPFGPDAPGSTSDRERMKFTGHERDFGGGTTPELDYMHARYYSGGMGRFLSVDPYLDAKRHLRKPQGWNRYTYVENKLVNARDPDGRAIETLADIGFVAHDVLGIASTYVGGDRPTTGQWVSLGGNVLGAGIPFFTGGGALAKLLIEGRHAIGFAESTAKTALTADRLQHASRHLTEAGILGNWSKPRASSS